MVIIKFYNEETKTLEKMRDDLCEALAGNKSFIDNEIIVTDPIDTKLVEGAKEPDDLHIELILGSGEEAEDVTVELNCPVARVIDEEEN